jgi:hypothetical protein
MNISGISKPNPIVRGDSITPLEGRVGRYGPPPFFGGHVRKGKGPVWDKIRHTAYPLARKLKTHATRFYKNKISPALSKFIEDASDRLSGRGYY